MSTTSTSNSHFSSQYRLDRKPDMSSQINHTASFNANMTFQKDLDRFDKQPFSSKLLIFDNTRTVRPHNQFGTRIITPINQRQVFRPGGMDGQNSRPISGVGFTKPFVYSHPQNSTFVKG